MPSFELTENLRQTIRDLRKKKKLRGDTLSKELGKGASYISQIENGKIKEIDFELLDNIFRRITELPPDEYNDFLDNMLNDVSSHLTTDELQHEKWMHQFNHEIRQYPITDALIEFIHEALNELNYTPEEFVDIINQNRGLKSVEIPEPNKLQIEIIGCDNGYKIISSIRFELPSNFISDVLSRKEKTISYVNMQGILFNLFISKGCSSEEAHEKTETLLYENKFYTINERNKIIATKLKEKKDISDNFNLYDILPTDYDKKFYKLKEEIDDKFSEAIDYLKDRNIVTTCEQLEKLNKNITNDLALVYALSTTPLYPISSDLKKDFWEDFQNLVISYIEKSKE